MINRESGLKPRLTREFLDTLLEAGKICGWSVDYVEIKDFVGWCFEIAEETSPTAAEFEPYEDDSDRIAFWMEGAARQTRNVDFYRAIIYQIGELFGDAAKTSDDGTIQDDVLALRVPELIKVLVGEHDRLRAENERLRALLHRWLGSTCDMSSSEARETIEVPGREQ